MQFDKNILVSIIVPIYNVEKYLYKCLDSIINQLHKNLQIILIDDGSTDNSGKICDEYAIKDNRVQVIHKTNGGISSARNCGLDIVSGEYVLFIDGDDYLELDYVSSLLEHAANDTITCCGYKRIFENKIVEHKFSKLLEYDQIQFLNVLQDYELKYSNKPSVYPIGNYMWNKIFPAHLFKDIRFSVGHTYEDIFINLKLFIQISKFIVIPNAGYNYVSRNGSIVASPKKNNDIDFIMARLEQEQDLSLNNELLLKAYVLTVYAVVNCYHHYCNGFYELNEQEIEKLKEIIKVRKCYIPNSHYKLLIKTYLILYAEIVLKAIYNTKRLLK